MKSKRLSFFWSLGFVVASGCSKTATEADATTAQTPTPPPSGGPVTPAEGGTAPVAPKPKEPEIVWDGGQFDGETLAIRVVPAIGVGGAKKAVDVWAEDAVARRWVRLAKGVDYGRPTDRLAVPKRFGAATVYFFGVDEGPPKDMQQQRNRAVSVSWPAGPHAKGPFTVITTDERDFLSSQIVNEAEPAHDFAPSDKPRIQFRIALVQGLGLPNLEFGTVEGACLDSNAGYNEGLIEVPAGTLTPALFDAGATSGCKGSKLAQAAPITLAAGDIAMVVAVGETAQGLELTVVKLGQH